MSKESIEEFLARGGNIQRLETPQKENERKHWTQKDKIDVAIGVNRKTGAQKMFDRFAKGFLGKGNTSWRYGK